MSTAPLLDVLDDVFAAQAAFHAATISFWRARRVCLAENASRLLLEQAMAHGRALETMLRSLLAQIDTDVPLRQRGRYRARVQTLARHVHDDLSRLQSARN